MSREQFSKAEDAGFYNFFKLQTVVNTSNMVSRCLYINAFINVGYDMIELIISLEFASECTAVGNVTMDLWDEPHFHDNASGKTH